MTTLWTKDNWTSFKTVNHDRKMSMGGNMYMFLWSSFLQVMQTPYLSSCMSLEPQTEWSCCLGWNWQTGPADRNQTARVPAADPHRTSILLHPGHLALSSPHSGCSSDQWGRESLKVDLHVVSAHTDERRSDEGKEIIKLFSLLTMLVGIINPQRIVYCKLDQCLFHSKIPDLVPFTDELTCGLYLPPLSLRFPDSWQ